MSGKRTTKSLALWTRVEVNWTDSMKGNGDWIFLSKEDTHDKLLKKLNIVSIGYVVKDCNEYIGITGSMQDFVYPDDDRCVICPLYIPRSAIASIKTL